MRIRLTLSKTILLTACSFAGLSSTADPLHPVGKDGAWRHEYSGWQFVKQVGDFTRVMAPYTIDGNNDAGVRYEHSADGQRFAAEVEIYLADSAAPDAKLDGAKANAVRKAGNAARIESEQPFQVGETVRGVKVTYAADANSITTQTNLYYFATNRWTVKVLGSADTTGDSADKELDAFVRALPWHTLGDPAALH